MLLFGVKKKEFNFENTLVLDLMLRLGAIEREMDVSAGSGWM